MEELRQNGHEVHLAADNGNAFKLVMQSCLLLPLYSNLLFSSCLVVQHIITDCMFDKTACNYFIIFYQ
jgi:hypothetical protein